MRLAAIVIVFAGIAFVLGVTISGNFDMFGVAILALTVAVGALGIAVVRRSVAGPTPAQCDSCGGLLSPHAPYCKHCGAVQSR